MKRYEIIHFNGKADMDLFTYMEEQNRKKESPLASRMRPRTLDEIVGQDEIIGKGRMLYRAIKADKLQSVIFYGPPGTGKTTLAEVIANTTKADFKAINATTSGKKDMENVVKEAREMLGAYGRRTILFIDEIHRFNKSQQDYLLPYVENGTLTLIGATTENPYFEVNGALLSRSMIFELKPLSSDDIVTIIKRALTDKERGLGAFHPLMDDEAVNFLSGMADGDARRALNALELAALTTDPSDDGKIHITADVISECIQRRIIRYDREGDNHYDTISAFIKSMRGSDPDAAVYYLARMLSAGEDVKFIARRIMIHAAEDVGLADPNAIVVASAAASAVERVGMPEGRIILAEAAAYIATAPKSNSIVCAIDKAMDLAEKTGSAPVPRHLQDSHYGGSGKLGKGVGYKYPHDFHEHYVSQQYLPDPLVGEKIYEPGDIGYEADLKKRLEKLRSEYGENGYDPPGNKD